MFAIIVAGYAGRSWPDEASSFLRGPGIVIGVAGGVLFVGGLVGPNHRGEDREDDPHEDQPPSVCEQEPEDRGEGVQDDGPYLPLVIDQPSHRDLHSGVRRSPASPTPRV